LNKPQYNNQIRAEEIRLVDEDGQQLGIFNLPDALNLAKEKGLDLIMVTDKAVPPICKIGDYGKYLYSLKKKERKNIAGSKHGETKNIRLSFNISDNDMLTRVKAAEKFLNKGDKVNIELRLKGREKQLSNVGFEKIKKFIALLEEKVAIRVEKEIKKEPKGLSVTILKK
jgi:translation initiation factor IF-3